MTRLPPKWDQTGRPSSRQKAQVAQKTASLKVAQTNLDYTIIRAPIDGTVVNRNIDIGQTVAASLQAPTLFTIPQDLTKLSEVIRCDERHFNTRA